MKKDESKIAITYKNKDIIEKTNAIKETYLALLKIEWVGAVQGR
jgi:hypothetical protein